jgi:hypothetical protein
VERAGVVVLILSSHAGNSRMVKLELTQAAKHNIDIIPLRIEDVQPGALEFFIRASHWLDAFRPPLEAHLDALVGAVRQLLRRTRRKSGLDVLPYMITRGPDAHRDFTGRPGEPWDDPARGALANKEEHVRRRYGELVLVQKSSALVPGTPALPAESIYGMLLGKSGDVI